MPLPRWLARTNKRVFNPIEIRRGVRPVIIHVGRSSGKTYRTPLDAHPLANGYLFIPMYGPRSDWVRNVLAAGAARLRLSGEEIELESPRLVKQRDAWPLLLRPGKPHRASRATPNYCRWTSGSGEWRVVSGRFPRPRE